MSRYDELKDIAEKVAFIIYDNGINRKQLDEHFGSNTIHVVIVSIDGETLYDSYFVTAIPNYGDNPAIQCAIKTQDQGEYNLIYGDIVELYFGLFNCENVIMVSTDKLCDPRNQAWIRLLNMDYGFTVGDAAYVTEQFACDGLFCSPGGCHRGREAIFEEVNSYISSGIDKDIVLIPRAFYYDPIINGGVLERLWSAVDLTVTPNEYYEQDDALVYRLDPQGFLSLYHEYFNFPQRVSSYTKPPVIDPICGPDCKSESETYSQDSDYDGEQIYPTYHTRKWN